VGRFVADGAARARVFTLPSAVGWHGLHGQHAQPADDGHRDRDGLAAQLAIVAFDKKSRQGAEAALKYAIFGAISSAIMLYGVSLLYGMYQTLNVSVIANGVVHAMTRVTAGFWPASR